MATGAGLSLPGRGNEFPAQLCKIFLFIYTQNELHTGSIWSGATTLLTSPPRFVMKWLLALYTRFVSEPSRYFLHSKPRFLYAISNSIGQSYSEITFNHTISHSINILCEAAARAEYIKETGRSARTLRLIYINRFTPIYFQFSFRKNSYNV